MIKPCYELRLRSSGMFSIVNEVVQYLHIAQKRGFEFYIDGRHSCYKDPAQAGDPWEYYFEPCFVDAKPGDGPVKLLPVGKKIACAKNNIITPRLVDGKCAPLLLPANRSVPNAIISKHLKLKPTIKRLIDDFVENHFTPEVIGLHLRGLGRDHGGAGQLREKGGSSNAVDYSRFFKQVDLAFDKMPKAKLLVCSDSQTVIDHVCETYGSRVITYGASRSPFGEMHASHPKNEGLSFSPYKLGLDIVVEAYLLARTDFFIHGNSNVANFVISLNDNLDTHYVYHDVELG